MKLLSVYAYYMFHFFQISCIQAVTMLTEEKLCEVLLWVISSFLAPNWDHGQIFITDNCGSVDEGRPL
jgi:hypothetical protein